MTDNRNQLDPSRDTDATDVAVEDIIPPKQPPMDDAAGGPQAIDSGNSLGADTKDAGDDDDLSVQGGE